MPTHNSITPIAAHAIEILPIRATAASPVPFWRPPFPPLPSPSSKYQWIPNAMSEEAPAHASVRNNDKIRYHIGGRELALETGLTSGNVTNSEKNCRRDCIGHLSVLLLNHGEGTGQSF